MSQDQGIASNIRHRLVSVIEIVNVTVKLVSISVFLSHYVTGLVLFIEFINSFILIFYFIKFSIYLEIDFFIFLYSFILRLCHIPGVDYLSSIWHNFLEFWVLNAVQPFYLFDFLTVFSVTDESYVDEHASCILNYNPGTFDTYFIIKKKSFVVLLVIFAVIFHN